MSYLQKNWFQVEKMTDKTWLINDHGLGNIYLVEGRDKALLIDTGCGIGDLRETVSGLTDLPVCVVNTHGHPDHILGNHQFYDVYMAEKDIAALSQYVSTESRRLVLKYIIHDNLPDSFSTETWCEKPVMPVAPLLDGSRIDLGDREMEVIALPGHSAGSIGLLDAGDGVLFSGDSILGGNIWVHYADSLPLSVYLHSLQSLQNNHSGKFERILPGHIKTPLQPDLLNELLDGVGRIVRGEIVGQPHATFMGDGLLCKFNGCGIVYHPERIAR